MPERAPAVATTSLRLRRGILPSAGLVLCLCLLVPALPVAARTPGQGQQSRFMWAMAGQESGWDYYARNASSGAFGKYQIMPFNWPVWAARYLGDARADQTPWNQEEVAYGRIRDLYVWLGTWKRVAYWWLTGLTERSEKRWSSYARGYVQAIMRLRQRAPRVGAPMPARTASRSGRGDWRRSASTSRLRLGIGGRAWPRRGVVQDGGVLKVHRAVTKPNGVHWISVVTIDGRSGWLPQSDTVPAHRPSHAARWRDVQERGHQAAAADRRMARPRPR